MPRPFHDQTEMPVKDGATAADSHAAAEAELTLRNLRVFIALAEAGSVAAAARRLGASSSGVSQHVTALEAAVGARLFDRRARPVVLTPAGVLMRDHARRILSVVSDAEAALAAFSLDGLPVLNLAIIDDLDASLTPVMVASLQARYPRCFVNAFSGRSDQILDRLAAREADLGVTALEPADPAAYRILPLLNESFVLVMAQGSRRPGESWPAAMERLPHVAYSEAIPIGRTIATHLARLRLSVPRRHAFEATRSVLAMVVQSGGWALTTPLNLLDAERFVPMVDIAPLPFAGISRRVQLVARSGELGGLPETLAADCRALLRTRVAPRFAAIAPGLAGAIEVAEEPVDWRQDTAP